MSATIRFLKTELSRHIETLQHAHAALMASDDNEGAQRDAALGLAEAAARSYADLAASASARPELVPKKKE